MIVSIKQKKPVNRLLFMFTFYLIITGCFPGLTRLILAQDQNIIRTTLVNIASKSDDAKFVEERPDGSYKIEFITPQKFHLAGSAEGFIEINKRLTLFPNKFIDERMNQSDGESRDETIDLENNPIGFESNPFIQDAQSRTTIIYGKESPTDEETPLEGVIISVADDIDNEMFGAIFPSGIYKSKKSIEPNYQISGSGIGFVKIEKKIFLLPGTPFSHSKSGSIQGVVSIDYGSVSTKEIMVVAENEAGNIETTKTASDGKFKLKNLFDGVYTLSVIDEKFIFPKKTIVIRSGLEKQNVLIKASTGTVYGSIKEHSTDKPIANAIITFNTNRISNTTDDQINTLSSISNKFGKYEIFGFGEGEYRIQIYVNNFGILVDYINIVPDKSQYKKDFILFPGGSISGQITGMSNESEIEFNIIDENDNFLKVEDVSLDKSGKYMINYISPGKHSLLLKLKDTIYSYSNIKVSSGKISAGIDFNLNEVSGSISGFVNSSQNSGPIAGVVIIAGSKNSSNFGISSNDGSYKISGLEPGTYNLYVSGAGFEEMTKKNLKVEKNKEIANTNFNLSPKKYEDL